MPPLATTFAGEALLLSLLKESTLKSLPNICDIDFQSLFLDIYHKTLRNHYYAHVIDIIGINVGIDTQNFNRSLIYDELTGVPRSIDINLHPKEKLIVDILKIFIESNALKIVIGSDEILRIFVV